jgi:hypothetical protein
MRRPTSKLATVVYGLSFHLQCIAPTSWQQDTYDRTGAVALTDIGASFPIVTAVG